jgi:hypothetical protein
MSKTVMQQALDALEKPLLEGRLTPACIQKNQEAIAALRAELAKPDYQKANARLITSLENILVWDDGNLPGDMLDEARAAITKATGD